MTAPVTWSLPTELQTGTHAARPAVTAVGEGALYSCTTHGLVYQMVAGAWGTWLTLPAAGSTGTVTTVEEVDGSPTDSAVTKIVFPNGTLAIASHVATYTPAAAGLTSSYLGYNTVGGTEESTTSQRLIAKSVTTSGACILQSVECYTREIADTTEAMRVCLFDNNAGAIGKLLAYNTFVNVAMTNNATFGDGSTTSIARWLALPLSYALAASTTYWIGVFWIASQARMFYDGSGTDRRFDSGGDFMVDGGRYTQTDTTRKYSMRALTIA